MTTCDSCQDWFHDACVRKYNHNSTKSTKTKNGSSSKKANGVVAAGGVDSNKTYTCISCCVIAM